MPEYSSEFAQSREFAGSAIGGTAYSCHLLPLNADPSWTILVRAFLVRSCSDMLDDFGF
jgi:hypothetical protein